MVAHIAETEFSGFSLVAFLRAASVEIAERLSFDLTMMSCKACGMVSRVPSSVIREWFSFGILRLPGRMSVTLLLASVTFPRHCEVD